MVKKHIATSETYTKTLRNPVLRKMLLLYSLLELTSGILVR
jgi:hypothetical protein